MRVAVRQLSKAYGVLWALKDIDFEITGGECVALLGPNGAGKSTLLKLLAGLTRPTRGTIELDGSQVGRGGESDKSRIGLLVPGEHLYDDLTARENLRFFTALYKKNNTEPKIDRALAEVGLAARSDEYVAAFSSGMKCRLSIAKWNLLDPELLLLDEPYSVLDREGVDFLEQSLARRCQRGSIVMMASHHVARAIKICSRALVLRQGKLIFDEPRRHPWESFDRLFGEFRPRGE
ncbi:MAG TPA: heme ABC exporter ATP-binding protein CcmA [Candidatus Eisenbacteria bacterium]|nr:heme ABC exporter ATP-binding protein CcmA [Candidatus Eisenbacteria bacterium]